jgi:hypothetical protein
MCRCCYMPRRDCDATRTIASRACCICSALMPGRIRSILAAKVGASRKRDYHLGSQVLSSISQAAQLLILGSEILLQPSLAPPNAASRAGRSRRRRAGAASQTELGACERQLDVNGVCGLHPRLGAPARVSFPKPHSTATCGSSAGLGDAVKRRSNADSCARSWPSTPI